MITGGAGFLGVQHAEAIAEMGGIPIIIDIEEDRIDAALDDLQSQGFKNCKGIVLDITDVDGCLRTVDSVVEEYGKIDVLINNAALAMKGLISQSVNTFSPIEDYPLEIWKLALTVNLTGTFLITQAVGKKMINQKKGVIINIASDLGVISPDWRIYEADKESGYEGVTFNTPIHYTATKTAIIGMTRHLATHWARYNIRVNAISFAGMYNEQDEAFVERLSSLIPLGRMAEKYEYKGVIVFLASDASSFMTGTNLIIDGGRSSW